MPKINDIALGRDIGLIHRRESYIWLACPRCGKERWVARTATKHVSYTALCAHCSRQVNCIKHGEQSTGWKRGWTKTGKGYIRVLLQPEDFYYQMTGKNIYVMEHRLIMAKHLGRCLQSWEIVHHKNGIKNDNRFSNLKLSTRGSHTIEHSQGYRDGYRQGYQDGQSEAIKELKKEIKLLQWQIRQAENMVRAGGRYEGGEK